MLRFFLYLTTILTLLCSFPSNSQAESAREKTIVLGKVSINPKKHFQQLNPIAHYVAAKMAPLGITGAQVKFAKDNEEMIRFIEQGEVDWITETPFSALVFQKKAQAEIILKRWKKGVPSYHTVFICRKESPINSLRDLNGKKIAFEDPGSTSAFFIPMAIMKKSGLKMQELQSLRNNAGKDKVGYVFSGQEINSSTWVYRGMVDAAAYSNLDWDKDDHTPAQFRNEMRIFHASAPIPRALELVRKNLDPAIKQRLIEILLAASSDPAGQKALAVYNKTAKLERLSQQDLDGMKQLQEYLKVLNDS